jgi:hypothetical protein
VLGCDRPGPPLHGRTLDLDGPAAAAADQVVVGVGAAPVDRLTVLGAQHVHLAGVGEPLQGPVDGGQPDRVAAPAEQVVDLLGRAEVLEGVHGLHDGEPLLGGAHRCRPRALSARHSALRARRGGDRRGHSRRGRRAAPRRGRSPGRVRAGECRPSRGRRAPARSGSTWPALSRRVSRTSTTRALGRRTTRSGMPSSRRRITAHTAAEPLQGANGQKARLAATSGRSIYYPQPRLTLPRGVRTLNPDKIAWD